MKRTMALGAGTSLSDRKIRAGQRLLVGWRGDVTEDLRKALALVQPAGFLLLGGQALEAAAVSERNRELASHADPHYPALLAVDQEGGRVLRAVDPEVGTPWPAMKIVGRVRDRTGPLARALAREIRALGFNLNLAPVADVNSHPDNPIIGDRAFGSDPRWVAGQVAAFVEAHQGEHVIATAKHFPGHGHTTEDSHETLPRIEASLPDLRERELIPFEAAIQAGVGVVMTAHVVYAAIDPDRPATLSEIVVPRLLRDELSFDGVVLSDDLEMAAIADRWAVRERVDRATRASVDLLLFKGDPDAVVVAYDALVHAQEVDRGMDRASAASMDRIDALRERFFLQTPPSPGLDVVGHADHRALAQDIAERYTWS